MKLSSSKLIILLAIITVSHCNILDRLRNKAVRLSEEDISQVAKNAHWVGVNSSAEAARVPVKHAKEVGGATKKFLAGRYEAAASAIKSKKHKSFYNQFQVLTNENEVDQADLKIREKCERLAGELTLNNRAKFINKSVERKTRKTRWQSR